MKYLLVLLLFTSQAFACDINETVQEINDETNRLYDLGVLNEQDLENRMYAYEAFWEVHTENESMNDPELLAISIEWMCSILNTTKLSMEMVEKYTYLTEGF